MYKTLKPTSSTIEINNSYEGETIEQKINRIVNNKEPITDGAPIIYTERKEGVIPSYDIRTDRFELAVEAMDSLSRQHIAKRKSATPAETPVVKLKDGEPESTQGTSDISKPA